MAACKVNCQEAARRGNGLLIRCSGSSVIKNKTCNLRNVQLPSWAHNKNSCGQLLAAAAATTTPLGSKPFPILSSSCRFQFRHRCTNNSLLKRFFSSAAATHTSANNNSNLNSNSANLSNQGTTNHHHRAHKSTASAPQPLLAIAATEL